jgi:hypothetical protein
LITPLAIAVCLTLAACSHDHTLTATDAAARIDAAAALNTTEATYNVSDVKVTLSKVVSLSDGNLGLRFAFDSTAPGCCTLFPRMALANDAGPSTDVIVPASVVASDGTMQMRLFERGAKTTVPFVIDLRSVGVTL